MKRKKKKRKRGIGMTHPSATIANIQRTVFFYIVSVRKYIINLSEIHHRFSLPLNMHVRASVKGA